MLTQAKLDQVMVAFGALQWRRPERSLLDWVLGGVEVLWGPLGFFVDARAEHGLGDLVLGALLRAVKGETEGYPRKVLACRQVQGALCIETVHSRVWVVPAGYVGEARLEPAPEKRFNEVLHWGAEVAPAGQTAVPYGFFVAQVRRLLPGVMGRAARAWWQPFVDWLGAVARTAGGEMMKDLNDALKFYDRNREKIESLLQFRAELAEESAGFARRLEAKLRASGVDAGLKVVEGRFFRLGRTVRVGGKNFVAGVEVEVALERLALHVEPGVWRDCATRRRPGAEEAAEVLAKLGLAPLAGDRRINPDNPEAVAYQTLKTLFQSADEALKKFA